MDEGEILIDSIDQSPYKTSLVIWPLNQASKASRICCRLQGTALATNIDLIGFHYILRAGKLRARERTNESTLFPFDIKFSSSDSACSEPARG
jgi:hypothetical protein